MRKSGHIRRRQAPSSGARSRCQALVPLVLQPRPVSPLRWIPTPQLLSPTMCRLLGVQTPDGRRIKVQLANAAQAAGLHSGMHLELTGHFMGAQAPQQQQQQQGGVSAAAAAGNTATRRRFAATSLQASGGRAATPQLATLRSGSVVASAAGRATAVTKQSSNQLVAKDVSTIFIPSEPGTGMAQGRSRQGQGSGKLRGWRPASWRLRDASLLLTSCLLILSTGRYMPARLSIQPLPPPPSHLPAVAAMRGGKACPGTALPKFTIPEIKKAVFQEANPSGVTVGSTYNKCRWETLVA